MNNHTMKKIGAVVALVLVVLLLRNCGSDKMSDADTYVSDDALVSAYNKDAGDKAKFYNDGSSYVTQSGLSLQFQQSEGKVIGLLAIRNKDMDAQEVQKQVGKILAMVQNQKKLKDEDKVFADLHLTDTSDSEVYQATSDTLHIEKLAVNTVDIGGVANLNAPLTLVHFYSEGANSKLQASSGKPADFKTFALDFVANGVVQLDRFDYFPQVKKAQNGDKDVDVSVK